ncbi:MAG: hypothetical protein AAF542_05050 [Pseudomonadota bacterium]
MSANSACGFSGDRIEGELEIGFIPAEANQLDLIARQSFGALRPLYTRLESGVVAPVAVKALERTTTLSLS